jgi:hypothetical protein
VKDKKILRCGEMHYDPFTRVWRRFRIPLHFNRGKHDFNRPAKDDPDVQDFNGIAKDITAVGGIGRTMGCRIFVGMIALGCICTVKERE